MNKSFQSFKVNISNILRKITRLFFFHYHKFTSPRMQNFPTQTSLLRRKKKNTDSKCLKISVFRSITFDIITRTFLAAQRRVCVCVCESTKHAGVFFFLSRASPLCTCHWQARIPARARENYITTQAVRRLRQINLCSIDFS